LGPNKEPKSAQISHYWPQKNLALTPHITKEKLRRRRRRPVKGSRCASR